jgi:hypothetical protein
LLGAEDLVGAATFALAVATLFLVGVATWQAVLTRRAVGIARDELSASLRPVLIDVPLRHGVEPERIDFEDLGVPIGPEWSQEETQPGTIFVSRAMGSHDYLVSVPVRNVGPGVAVVSAPHPTCFQERDGAHTQGRISRKVIPTGEEARLTFRLTTDRRTDAFYAQIAYTDIAGEQMTRTQFYVRRPETPDAQHEVRGLALFLGHSDQPSVAYGEGFD